MSITTGIAPLTVSFTDTSTGDGLKYTWAFGDGGTSTQPNPTYIYEEANNYEVTLLVENDNGHSKASHTVIVSEPPSSNGGGMSPSWRPPGMSPSPMGMGPGWKRNLLP